MKVEHDLKLEAKLIVKDDLWVEDDLKLAMYDIRDEVDLKLEEDLQLKFEESCLSVCRAFALLSERDNEMDKENLLLYSKIRKCKYKNKELVFSNIKVTLTIN